METRHRPGGRSRASAASRAAAVACAALFAFGCSRNAAYLDQQDRADSRMTAAVDKQRAGDLEGAIRLYREALVRDPGNARAHLDIAMLLHDQYGDFIGAVYHYRRYLELRPTTQKRDVIERRLRYAGQSYAMNLVREEFALGQGISPEAAAASLVGVAGDKAAALDKVQAKNLGLSETVRKLEAENGALKDTLQRMEAELQDIKRALAQARSSTPPRTPVVRTYRVKRSDTLSSIAAEIYNDAGKWKAIKDANQALLGSANRLEVGQVLVIP